MPAGKLENFLYQCIQMFIKNYGADATNLCVYVCITVSLQWKNMA